jgi:hypothetical protein
MATTQASIARIRQTIVCMSSERRLWAASATFRSFSECLCCRGSASVSDGAARELMIAGDFIQII